MLGRAVSGRVHQVHRMRIIRTSRVRSYTKICYFGGRSVYDLESKHDFMELCSLQMVTTINDQLSLNFTRLCHSLQNDHVTGRVFEQTRSATQEPFSNYGLSDFWHPTMDILHQELYDK